MQLLIFYKSLDNDATLGYYSANRITHSYRERWRDRPYETRQPSYAMVLNPARTILIDERKADFKNSFLGKSFSYLLKAEQSVLNNIKGETTHEKIIICITCNR